MTVLHYISAMHKIQQNRQLTQRMPSHNITQGLSASIWLLFLITEWMNCATTSLLQSETKAIPRWHSYCLLAPMSNVLSNTAITCR